MKYETGATTHAVNDLILFTDNTRDLAQRRDVLYAYASKDTATGQTRRKWLTQDFYSLLYAAKQAYKKEFRDSSEHIENMTTEENKEYCTIYAQDFDNWKLDHQ